MARTNKELHAEKVEQIQKALANRMGYVGTDLESYSIGKMRATLEKNGIRAGKMRRSEMLLRLKRIAQDQNAAEHLDTAKINKDV